MQRGDKVCRIDYHEKGGEGEGRLLGSYSYGEWVAPFYEALFPHPLGTQPVTAGSPALLCPLQISLSLLAYLWPQVPSKILHDLHLRPHPTLPHQERAPPLPHN